MRINQFLAKHTDLSRRKADEAIAEGRVQVNGSLPSSGQQVTDSDEVMLDRKTITPNQHTITLVLHKPIGYVVSRDGQGSKTVYDLLPAEYHKLNPVGRLDKDSSGLLILTNDGQLANELTHPRYGKQKTYEIRLNTDLAPLHRQMINEHGILLDDGPSKLTLERIHDGNDREWIVRMSEGRNRQIRRTFSALNYTVKQLHRTHFGQYTLDNLKQGEIRIL